MRVQVAFTVPVEVVLEIEDDLSSGSIRRVVVIDEEVKLARDDGTPDGKSIHDGDYNDIGNVDVRALALELVQDPNTVWPAWEFGF